MEEVHITLDLDDITEVREKGHIVRDNVYFSDTTDREVSSDEYVRICTLTESTLYQNGEAHWPGEPEVHVTFERPTLQEIVDAEIQHIDERYDENMRVEQREWLDGQLYQLENIRQFLGGWYSEPNWTLQEVVGQEIVEVREMTENEQEREFLHAGQGGIPVLVLENGVELFPSQDPEGNWPGALFGRDDEGFVLFPK